MDGDTLVGYVHDKKLMVTPDKGYTCYLHAKSALNQKTCIELRRQGKTIIVSKKDNSSVAQR